MKIAKMTAMLVLLTACRETEAPSEVEIQFDEQALAQVLVESLVAGTSAFAESSDEEMPNAVSGRETIRITGPDGSEMVLELDPELLAAAIERGMIKATTPIIQPLEPVEPSSTDQSDQPKSQSSSIVVKILGNGDLYGVKDGDETLIASGFTDEHAQLLQEWFEKVSADRSQTWVVKIQPSRSTTFGLVQAVVRAAQEMGLDQVTFGISN